VRRNGARPGCCYCGVPTGQLCSHCRRPLCPLCRSLHALDAGACEAALNLGRWLGAR